MLALTSREVSEKNQEFQGSVLYIVVEGEYHEVHQESKGKGVSVCLRKAKASARVDVLATPSLRSMSHSSDPHFGELVQVFVKNIEGKATVHKVSWDTMLSEFVYEGVWMCTLHIMG